MVSEQPPPSVGCSHYGWWLVVAWNNGTSHTHTLLQVQHHLTLGTIEKGKLEDPGSRISCFYFQEKPISFFFILLKLFKIYHLDSAYLWSSAFAQNCQSPSVFHNGSKIKHNLEKLRAQAYVFKVRESKQSKYLLTNM